MLFSLLSPSLPSHSLSLSHTHMALRGASTDDGANHARVLGEQGEPPGGLRLVQGDGTSLS